MTDLVERISKTVSPDCLATRCRKEGCSLVLTNAPTPNILIDMDHPKAPVDLNQSRCDYLFIGGNSEAWLVPMELKRGKPNTSQIVRQLQAGSDVADRIVPDQAQIRFRPIAVYGGELRRIERDNMLKNANRIRFRSQRQLVKLVRCGTTLYNALRLS